MIAKVLPLGVMAAGLLLVGCTTAAVKPQSTAAAANDRACSTGSRIPRSGPCGPAGRVYTDKDIEITGASTTAEALRLLDPSIVVSR